MQRLAHRYDFRDFTPIPPAVTLILSDGASVPGTLQNISSKGMKVILAAKLHLGLARHPEEDERVVVMLTRLKKPVVGICRHVTREVDGSLAIGIHATKGLDESKFRPLLADGMELEDLSMPAVCMDSLLQFALGKATPRLQARDAFPPFGIVVGADGKMREMTAPAPAAGAAPPTSESVLGGWRAVFSREAKAGRISLCALVRQTEVMVSGSQTPVAAVMIELENQAGLAMTLFYPYSVALDNSVRFGESHAQVGQGAIFPAAS